ncbi:MAG TPA: type II secretion system secretin GspD [Paucimonas sp.]|nr:type II secretion system secretin GspD [Paucimonas sp.]
MTKHCIAKKPKAAFGWRRWSAAVALSCTMGAAGVPPAHAQDPAAGEATLNFVGADIESVIKAIGHYTNRTFIIDPRVKGTINLVSEKPVGKAQAFNLLTSALRLQGYAVVTTDGFTKVVPEADAKLQAGPIQAGGAGEVRGDQIATQIFRLNYESAQTLVTVLRPLISPNNTINANPGNNSLVVTDYADNLKRISKIIAALDAPATGDLDIVPVKHAIATDIATMVNRLLDQGAAVPGIDAGRVTLLADTRTNSVIVRAPSPARANLAKSLIAKLDQPTERAGNVHVVYLRNAEAIKLAQTLRAVVSGDTSAPAATPTSSPSPTPAPSMNQPGGQQSLGMQPSSPAQQQQTSLPAGGPAGFIQADAATNSLIITASEPVYRNLRAVIDQLDARRAQVYVESLIVEVSSDKAAEFGIQWAGLSGDSGSSYRVGTLTGFGTGGNNLINIAASTRSGATPVVPGNGLNLGIFRQINGQLTLGALARALESEGNANILSMPNLITLDNEEAKIIVGQNVPFVTGQFTTSSSGAAGANPFQTIERKDVGLSLRVRPQVSEGGSVKMAIYQETSSVQPTSNAADIITNKRSIETNVLVDDGQIIVLGGLIDDTVNDNNEKVPGLGDVPLFGTLFKYQKHTRVKRNLMVFLRPTVIRTNEQSVNLASDRYNYIRNAEIAAQPAPNLILPNLGTPVLPPLKDGRISEGPLYNMRSTQPANGAAAPVQQPVQQPATQPTDPKQ